VYYAVEEILSKIGPVSAVAATAVAAATTGSIPPTAEVN
jgi:hypothetical protein